jgi:homogentisate 1,2-dioxygenase
MLPHGPDADAYEHHSTSDQKPVRMSGTMAFMFESRFPQRITSFAATTAALQETYMDCWKGLKKRFDPTNKNAW